MKQPPIHITPHDLHLSPALRDFIRMKISGLSRFAGDIVAAEVVLRGKSGTAHLFSVGARLALPGRDVQANATHGNFHTAIDRLVAKLARLSRKRKTRLARMTRGPGKKRIRRLPGPASFPFASSD
jgi:putative sigma-54 modulation protein